MIIVGIHQVIRVLMKHERTAMMIAAEKGHEAIVRSLKRFGGDVNDNVTVTIRL